MRLRVALAVPWTELQPAKVKPGELELHQGVKTWPFPVKVFDKNPRKLQFSAGEEKKKKTSKVVNCVGIRESQLARSLNQTPG